MANQMPSCESQAPTQAQPRAAAAWRRRFARRALRAARVRSLATLDRVALRRRAARVAVMPTVRYRDVPAAIAWLCAAFGMEVHRVVAGESGAPRYAELRFGGNLLMIAPIEDTAFGRLMVQPDEIGGVETQICYLHVEDVAIHYARAKAAGAEIVLDIEDEANSGRGYSCRDPEGHVWNFGTYHPWQKPSTGSDGAGRHRRRERNGLSVLILLLLAALLASGPWPPLPGARTVAALAETQIEEPAAIERDKREAAERAARGERERQAQLHSTALAAAEKGAAEAPSELVEARAAQQKAERESAAARARAEATLGAKLAAEGTAEKAKASLAAAEKDAKDARTLAALERSKRIAAEHAAARTRRRVASFRVTRPRPRVWCYNPNVPGAPLNRAQRLSGFCKG
jgi:uncharacterized glyoxalase superfamily protein PhnB